MKLLLVNSLETTAPGGISTTVRNVAAHLSPRHEVTVVQPNLSRLPVRERYEGFTIERVPAPFYVPLYGLNLALYRWVQVRYKTVAPDLVHIHGYHSLFSPETLALIRRCDASVPVVFSYHMDVFRERVLARHLWRLYGAVGKRIGSSVTHIAAVSRFEADVLRSELHVSPAHVSVIPHGVDTIDVTQPRRPHVGPRLLYVGHLIQRKNVLALVESLDALVHTDGPSAATLTIIGRGPQEAAIRRLVHERDLTHHVVIKPFVPHDELQRALRDADIFITLSHSEAYGIAVAEALAAGTPCIVANAAALSEFVEEPGCFGANVPIDPHEVAALINHVYHSHVTVGPFSDKIRTWDAVAATYEKLYCSLVE